MASGRATADLRPIPTHARSPLPLTLRGRAPTVPLEYRNLGRYSPVTVAASVRRHIRPPRACSYIAVTPAVLAIALALPPMAEASGGGVPSPDPSPQPAPDSAPSGGQAPTAGGAPGPAAHPASKASARVTTRPVIGTARASAVPARSVTVQPTALGGSAARRGRGKAPSRPRHAHHERQATTHSIRDLAAPFIAKLQPPFHTLGPASAAERKPGHALGLAAIALLLLVVTGLVVVRTSAQRLRSERPA